MEIKINLRKWYFALFLVLAGAGIVFAALDSSVPNPGHAVSELQKCDTEGEILQIISGEWGCASLPPGAAPQTLSLNGQALSISDGNSVSLPTTSMGCNVDTTTSFSSLGGGYYYAEQYDCRNGGEAGWVKVGGGGHCGAHFVVESHPIVAGDGTIAGWRVVCGGDPSGGRAYLTCCKLS